MPVTAREFKPAGSQPTGRSATADREEDRLAFVLAGQEHADHYLTPLADPRDKRVLVVGCGAGTDVLWCLRHGAQEVVGIDVLDQTTETLAAAAKRHDVDIAGVRFLKLPIEHGASLARRFDLVLANNVFEHVSDLAAAFAACAELVEPGTGRVAVFSAPLYWSSAGSHLSHEPWEHVWGDPEALRERLLERVALPDVHPLASTTLRDYLDREITLNQARLADFLTAIAGTDLVLLQLAVLPDSHAFRLCERLDELRAAVGGEAGAPAALDFALAGVALELALPEAGGSADDVTSTAVARLAAERELHGREVERRRAVEAEAEGLRREADELHALLAAVEASWSFRGGRLLTAPGRLLRRLLARPVR